MSEIVSSFIPVQAGPSRYLFFLVTWNEFITSITEELEKQRDAFGQALGTEGAVIQAFKSARRSTFDEVIAKPWPESAAERMKREQDPFMLVIREAFADFDPQAHPWAIVWFSDFRKDATVIYRIFGALAHKVRQQENVLEYLTQLSRREKYKAFTKYLEVKPGIFGVALDVKALTDDLLGV